MKESNSLNLNNPEIFINRELSWLDFSRRVLELAEDPATPLMERVKYAGIMGLIYDEFAMKRIGGLLRKISRKKNKASPDGLSPRQTLLKACKELNLQNELLSSLLENKIRPALADAGFPILNYKDLNSKQQNEVDDYFKNSVEPILIPLAVDGAHPFPFISTLGINIALQVKDKKKKNPRFVRIKVPPNRPRWVPLSGGGFVPLEQIIIANIKNLFPAAKEVSSYLFRVIMTHGTDSLKMKSWRDFPLVVSSAWLQRNLLLADLQVLHVLKFVRICQKNSNSGSKNNSK